MSLYAITEAVASALSANFQTHMTAVVNDAGLTLPTSATVYKRERAPSILERHETPGIGVWIQNAQAGAVRTSHRDWYATVMVDYVATGTDRADLGAQMELAAEAIMRCLDALGSGNDQFYGAGEEAEGTAVVHDLADQVQDAAGVSNAAMMVAAVRVAYPVRYRVQL